MNVDQNLLPVTSQTTSLHHPEPIEDPNEKYRILHQQVLDYQAGKPGAAEYILNSFEKFLYKYYHFIVQGLWTCTDTSIRAFISLFTDIGTKQVSKYRYNLTIQDKLETKGAFLHRLLRQTYEPEDVMQYLRLALLEMATRYNDHTTPNGSFHTYVHKNFHFYAIRVFPLKDPLVYSSLTYDMEDLTQPERCQETLEEYIRSERQIDHELLIEKTDEFIVNEQGISVYDDDILNLNWINGVTCSETFKELTPFERKLLLLSYHCDLQDADIAEEYGFCRVTINRKKMTAVKKLTDVI